MQYFILKFHVENIIFLRNSLTKVVQRLSFCLMFGGSGCAQCWSREVNQTGIGTQFIAARLSCILANAMRKNTMDSHLAWTKSLTSLWGECSRDYLSFLQLCCTELLKVLNRAISIFTVPSEIDFGLKACHSWLNHPGTERGMILELER